MRAKKFVAAIMASLMVSSCMAMPNTVEAKTTSYSVPAEVPTSINMETVYDMVDYLEALLYEAGVDTTPFIAARTGVAIDTYSEDDNVGRLNFKVVDEDGNPIIAKVRFYPIEIGRAHV